MIEGMIEKEKIIDDQALDSSKRHFAERLFSAVGYLFPKGEKRDAAILEVMSRYDFL